MFSVDCGQSEIVSNNGHYIREEKYKIAQLATGFPKIMLIEIPKS